MAHLGLHCPSCNHPTSEVKDSRPNEHGIRRRRVCTGCNQRFTTLEVIATNPDVAQELADTSRRNSVAMRIRRITESLETLLDEFHRA